MISIFGNLPILTWSSPCVVKTGTAPRRECKNATRAAMVCDHRKPGFYMARKWGYVAALMSKIGKKWVSYWFFTYGLKCVEIAQDGKILEKM